METDHGDETDDITERHQHQTPSSQAGRPPPIVHVRTSQANLIQLQKQLKGLLEGNFELRQKRKK
jgi:hypothetical protein